MESVSTLHDFVLNLLSDPTALTDFAQDPQAVLAQAGLGDITPGDVNNALPLVIDYAPSHLVPALEAALSTLPFDGLTDDPTTAIQHLTALTSAVSDTTTWLHVDDNAGVTTIGGGLANPDLGIATSGSVAGSLQAGVTSAFGLTSEVAHANFAGGVTGLAAGVTDFAAGGVVTGGLDGDVINKVTGGAVDGNALSGATAFATNLVADPTDVLSHPTDITNALTGSIGGVSLPTTLPADPTSAVSDTLHSVLANIPNPGDLGNTVGLGGLGGVTSSLTSVTGLNAHDPLSAVTSHLPAGVNDLVSGTVDHVTSQVPGVSDLTQSVTSVTETHTGASSTSPLDGVSASSVGDTVSHVTGTVTDTLHSVTDLGADHGGLLGL
jgi:hypothetical protein